MRLEVIHVSKAFDAHTVLSDVSCVLEAGMRVGIVGANGAGKSTLLQVMAGLLPPDEGQVIRARGMRIGYIPQAPEREEARTARELLAETVPHAHGADAALETLGVADCATRPLNTLSSGQRSRVYLARIAAVTCDVLLLDEPTNHLDADALEWLEAYVRTFPGIVCIVSHDRAFLDGATERTFELEAGSLKVFGGNYSFYKAQRAVERTAAVHAYETYRDEVARLTQAARAEKDDALRINSDRKRTRDNDAFAPAFFADRASKKKSSAAKVMERRMRHMDVVERPAKDPKLKLLFGEMDRGPDIVMRCEHVSFAVHGRTILDDVSCVFERGERVALVGTNGSGKTTFIKLLLGQLVPTSGSIVRGDGVRVGYLSQEHESLTGMHTTLAELTDRAGIDVTHAHRLLSWLLVSREKMAQAVGTLSTGEQSKVLLARIIASGAHLIILDEPTNHLDIPAREALEATLRAYEGTLLVVSHDRYFLEAIGVTREITSSDGRIA
jgi:ATP-binding cassette subfamily F protein 3